MAESPASRPSATRTLIEQRRTRLTARQEAARVQTTQQQQYEESERNRIERLGRERPPQFKSTWEEIGFCYSVVGSQLMGEYYVSGFNVLIPTLMNRLDIAPSAAVWPAAAFALVTSAFLLPFGRLADTFGARNVYLFGLVWFFVWSIIGGFSRNELMLNLCRALQGLGPAAFLPTGVMLMGKTYRPGPRKNLIFSIYGGSAPLGFFFGVFIAGLAGSFLDFGWYFWLGGILVFTTMLAAFFAIPLEHNVQRQFQMDWTGSALLVSGLVLTIFALTDGSHAPQKWATPFIIATLVLGVILLIATGYVEGYVAKNPLIPFSLFRVPYIKPLFLGLFLNYGCLGIFLLYATRYSTDILGATPIQISAWFVPMCAGGVVLSLAGGYVLHLVSGTVLIIISGCGWILSSIMFAILPSAGASFWAYVFPAMLGATVGVDIAFNVANIFISTSISVRQQGLAGSLCHQVLYLGIAVMLAFADVTQTETAKYGEVKSYHAVFWFMLACSGVSLAVMLFYVRIPKAQSDLTVDERQELLSPEDHPAVELQNRSRSREHD